MAWKHYLASGNCCGLDHISVWMLHARICAALCERTRQKANLRKRESRQASSTIVTSRSTIIRSKSHAWLRSRHAEAEGTCIVMNLQKIGILGKRHFHIRGSVPRSYSLLQILLHIWCAFPHHDAWQCRCIEPTAHQQDNVLSSRD